MANRFSIEARFGADTSRFDRGLRHMQRRTRTFASRLRYRLDGARAAIRTLSPAFTAVGAAAVAAGLAGAAALREVTQTGIDFDRTMARARARFRLAQTSEAFAALQEAAMRAGRTTEFSASQSAEALAALGAAGFDASQAVAALPGVVDLATAAQLELGDATSRAADALGQWGLMTSDTTALSANLTRANNVLAAASNSANLTMEDLSEAFRDAAPAARAAGISLEQTSAMIDVLAAAGVRGAEAGTAFRGVLQAMTAPTPKARRALRQLSVDMTDGHGNLRDMTEVLGDLRTAMAGLGTAERGRALTDIFGRQRATPAAILIEGASAARDFERALLFSEGAAARMAATMRDTAGGDLASFRSTLEGLALQIWAVVRGPVRAMVVGMTEWLRANQDWITSGFRDGVTFLREHLSEIGIVLKVVGAGLAIVGTLAGVLMAGVLAAAATIPALLTGVVGALAYAVDWLIDTAAPVVDSMVGLFRTMQTRAIELSTGLREFVVGALVLIGRAAEPYLRPIVAAFRTVAAGARRVWAPIGTFFSRLWSGIAGRARADFSQVVSIARRVVGALRSAWAPIGAFFSDLWRGIASSFERTLGGIVDTVSGLIDSTRAVGREALAESDDDTASARPQVISPHERFAHQVSETITRERAEVIIRDETEGGRAEVRRRPAGSLGLQLARSGVG